MGLLILLVQRHILDTFGTLFHDIPGMLLWFGQDPWVQGRCSFVWGHWMSSIALVWDGFVLFDRRIGCFHSKMANLVCCLGMGSVVCGPSIVQCCRSFGDRKSTRLNSS